MGQLDTIRYCMVPIHHCHHIPLFHTASWKILFSFALFWIRLKWKLYGNNGLLQYPCIVIAIHCVVLLFPTTTNSQNILSVLQCITELQPKSCDFRENLMHLYFVFCKWWNELKCKCKDAHVMVRFSKKQEFINFLLKDSQNILHSSDQSRLYFTFSIRRQRSLMPAAEAEVRRRCCKSAAEAYFCVTMCCEINSTL